MALQFTIEGHDERSHLLFVRSQMSIYLTFVIIKLAAYRCAKKPPVSHQYHATSHHVTHMDML